MMSDARWGTLAMRAAAIRVLIADDHPIVRAGLVSVLMRENDIEVVGEASDGQRAIALAREWEPDVVLMDLRMPVMDGIAAIEVIARECPATRILALTSYGGDADVRRALKAGARGYLLKDMLVTSLVVAVRAVHRGQRVMPSPVAERLAEFPFEPNLSPRELEVLRLIARGLGNKSIAAAMGRSGETIKAHIKSIFAKLDVHDRTEAVTVALARGLIHL
jgi:two-component system, NarL family, response regulator